MVSQDPIGSYAKMDSGLADISGVEPGRPWRGKASCGAMSRVIIDPRKGSSCRPTEGGGHFMIWVYAASSAFGSQIGPDWVIC